MKTKGINEYKDIDNLMHKDCNVDIKTTHECRCKLMMRSIYAYEQLSKNNTSLKIYKEKLGENVFNEVYDEYSKFLYENFTIEKNTYTDSEGCSYNSLIRKEHETSK